MKIDIPLINKVLLELNEIYRVSIDKKFDKDVVKKSVTSLIKDLTTLNTIQMEVIKEYKSKSKELFSQLENQINEMSAITESTRKYAEWIEVYYYSIKNNISLSDKFFQEGKEYEKHIDLVVKNPTRLNIDLLNTVLKTYIQIKLTKKRKVSIWLNYQIFRFKILTRSILNVIISAIIGFAFEELFEALFTNIPKYLIAVGVALLIFFTLEKLLGEKYNSFFWKQIQKQTYKLNLELKLYLQQINF